MAGKTVLELGPLEGAHTYQLHQRGANIVAVEASKQAYLKCLITKEIVGLPPELSSGGLRPVPRAE